MATYSNTAREVEMPNGDVVVIHNAPTGGENTTSNIKKFKYDDNGHVTESSAADAEDLNLSGYSTPTTGTTAIGASDDVQTAIGKLDHQSQIDQTNILLVEQMNGAKNLAQINDATFTRDMYIPCELKANTDYILMIQSFISESSSSTSQLLFYKGDTQITDGQGGVYRAVPHGNNVSLTIQIPGDCDRVRIYSGSEGASSDNKSATFTHLMFIEKSIYDAGLTQYMPFALPNYDLTQLEAEDRASLAEVVDASAKNKLKFDKDAIKSLNSGGSWSGYAYTPTTAPNLTVTINDDSTVTLNGSTSSSLVTVALERKASSGFQGYVLSGSKANTKLVYQLAVSPYTVYATADGVGSDVIANYTDGSTIQLSLQVVANSTFSNTIITPMICTEEAWKVSQNYAPFALPNTDLTRLEAEDRASLAEVVDSGAKNELQPTWTTQTINGVTFTVGSDGVITATTTGTRTGAAIYPLLSRYSGTKMAGKVMSISPAGGTNASYYVAAEQADSPWHNVGTDYGDGVVISSEANNRDINVNIVIPANYSPNNLKFSPMVATKAAFCLSSAFVPYKITFDNSIKKVASWLTSFSIPAETGTIKYLYVRGGSPTKMGLYLLANTGIITELASASFATFAITYNSNTNAFDCTSSLTVEAFVQTYPIP